MKEGKKGEGKKRRKEGRMLLYYPCTKQRLT